MEKTILDDDFEIEKDTFINIKSIYGTNPVYAENILKYYWKI